MLVLAIFGGMILALGLIMYTRGWIYFIKPGGKLAEKRKKRNLKMGWPTDMKLFGRKVRRVGFLTILVGGSMLAWAVVDIMGDAEQGGEKEKAGEAEEKK
jgi:hypothetical protein